MIREVLPSGAENAIGGKQLASMLGLDLRHVTKQVEAERLCGVPICAAVAGEDHGYYLAANAGELALYLRSLNRRIKNVTRTYQALDFTLSQMEGQERFEGWGGWF